MPLVTWDVAWLIAAFKDKYEAESVFEVLDVDVIVLDFV